MKIDNKLNLFFKILVFISSYIPVFIMIFLDNMNKFTLNDFRAVYAKNNIFWNIALIISGLALVSLLLWIKNMKKESKGMGKKYEIEILTSHDGEVLNYFATFIIPILSLNLSSWPSIAMNLIFVSIVGIYFIKNNTLYFNVILLIMGYRIYTDNKENIYISKKNKHEIINYNLKADQIGTSNIYYI